MNVVIVGNFWFPRGTASAARIRNLALGLKECRAGVHVISMAPHPPLEDGCGPGPGGARVHEGISYESAAPTVAAADGWRDSERSVPRVRSRFADKVRWFAGLYGATPRAGRLLRERIARKECDVVVAYDRSAVRMTPIARLCRRAGVTSVLDVTEVSEHLGRGPLSAIYWDSVAGTRSTPRLFDGVTLISSGLEALYRAGGCSRTMVLPAMEGWAARPPDAAPTGNLEFALTYVGALHERDAPELLLEAVGVAAREGVPLALDLVGHYEGTERAAALKRLCDADPHLSRVVRFIGSLGEGALRDRLARSDGLVLPRRSAPTEALAFPTRLVEYLRSGRPVFACDVGDVGRYLEDGREVVLLDPADPRKMARALAGVALSPDRGAAIGRRGFSAGARAFDRVRHARRLLEFAAACRLERAG